MNFSSYADSQSYFHPSEGFLTSPKLSQFDSVRGRLVCLGTFVVKLLVLPFALLFKVYKTFFRAVGVVLGAAFVLLTLGISNGARELFMRRVSYLARDLADWVLLPFAVFTCFVRLFLGFTIHPALYLGF